MIKELKDGLRNILGNDPTNNGRNIDTARGTLSGEGSEQRVHYTTEPYLEIEPSVFRSVPSEQLGLLTGDATYYGRPVVKKSVWTWMIPAYYYVGGATGGSAVLGAAATLMDRDGLPNIASHSRYIALVGAGISSVLLVADLGRPTRFLHMLRVFRPTSPMSMGSWILSAFGTFAGVAGMAEIAPFFLNEDLSRSLGLRAISNGFAIGSGLFGLGLAGYTGVLVGNTTVPVWQQARQYLPVLFLSSATASAASLFDLFEGHNAREHRVVRLFGIAGKIGELSAATAMERDLGTVPEVIRPLREGISGALWQTGKVLSAVSLGLALLPRFGGKAPGRKTRLAIGVCGTLGALCVRFGVHYAGHGSARNPRATFHQQRAGLGATAVTGRPAVTGPTTQDLRIPDQYPR
jgi:formate-dependent nitrite reductase membrane component NrfD